MRKMEFTIRYEGMMDGTLMAEAVVDGEGAVFLGFIGKGQVFVDAEVAEFVATVIEGRRAERAAAAAKVEAEVDVAALWAALLPA